MLKPSLAASPVRAAQPKSMMVQRFSRGSHITLPGLRSRCTYPIAWKSRSLIASWCIICMHKYILQSTAALNTSILNVLCADHTLLKFWSSRVGQSEKGTEGCCLNRAQRGWRRSVSHRPLRKFWTMRLNLTRALKAASLHNTVQKKWTCAAGLQSSALRRLASGQDTRALPRYRETRRTPSLCMAGEDARTSPPWTCSCRAQCFESALAGLLLLNKH
jgi:hypothetical protein